MTNGPLGQFGYFQYVSDIGKTYSVRHRVADAVAMGLAAAAAGVPGLPRNFVPRHCNGTEAASGKTRKLPVDTSSNAFYVAGGIVTVDGIAFKITGRTGEKASGQAAING